MTVSACLVTSSPSLEERKRTAPFLLPETADPDTRFPVVIDVTTPHALEFRVGVVSEDVDARVEGRLVLDYGFAEDFFDRPFRKELGHHVFVAPATLDDPPRTLASQWAANSNDLSPGCHNVAFFASHEFNEDTGCAADPSDFDFVMWTILVCKSDEGSCCDPTAPPESGGCTIACPPFDTKVRCGSSPSSSTGGSP